MWLQDFDQGSAADRDLLGGKGANLAEMTNMGIPVPPGFTVTTEACRAAQAAEGAWPDGLVDELVAAVERLESKVGRRFGAADDPLLVSVRSGARVSMPGMMDTVLDVGLNADSVKGMTAATGDAFAAVDSWRRFTEMFADVVLQVPHEALAGVRRRHLDAAGVLDAAELDVEASRVLVGDLRSLVEQRTGEPFPDDPVTQLRLAVDAVFRSWDGHRARAYRELTGVPHDLGTAVNVQAMVFGNLGDDSGTGVVFTRDPATGAPEPYGDWLDDAQGEDVVAGTRLTRPFDELAQAHPAAHDALRAVLDRLERRFRDMCDVEFTVERGRLWVLQTRVGKRSARAAVRMAVDMADEGLITSREAVTRVTPSQLEALLHPRFDPTAEFDVLTSGLAASPGAATGVVATTWQAAVELTAEGRDVVLVREETSPEDIEGIVAARGVLTSRGGLVSHAAVVARGLGRPAVCGAGDLDIDTATGEVRLGGEVVLRAGDLVSLDGTTGEVVVGEVPTVEPEATPQLRQLLAWADEHRRLRVRANADTADDARRARAEGAEGIGLARTEHMFLGDRLPLIRAVVLADGEAELAAALSALHDVQVQDFHGLLVEMDGLPVTVRLLDPPLHEFLPDLHELRVAEATGTADAEQLELLAAAERWQEHNPMLGTRGVRLGILLPELYRAQVRALAEATLRRLHDGGDPRPEVMIPLIIAEGELAAVAEDVRSTIARTAGGTPLHIPVGTMIETPRAALVADRLVADAEFMSFGTNDLTQLTMGLSRDDVGVRLLPAYVERGLLPADPFATLDQDGVGRLVSEAVRAVAAEAPHVHTGVCGEHGGDPASIAFFHRIGLEYVSCSPPRVPIARLAAARVALGVPADG